MKRTSRLINLCVTTLLTVSCQAFATAPSCTSLNSPSRSQFELVLPVHGNQYTFYRHANSGWQVITIGANSKAIAESALLQFKGEPVAAKKVTGPIDDPEYQCSIKSNGIAELNGVSNIVATYSALFQQMISRL